MRSVRIDGRDECDVGIQLKAVLSQFVGHTANFKLHVRMQSCDFDQVDKIAKALVESNHWTLVMWIGFKGLESVPESVWELTDLEELSLANNKLKTISPAIAKLTKLKRLAIEYNLFEGFPEAVCKLEQLQVLFVSACQLSVLPSSFASLRNLLELDLEYNTFEQFPEVICELRSLRELWLGGNKLASLPRSFANLRELRLLELSVNRFTEFPQVVCELPNLENLSMWRNQLSELPLAITKLVRLKYLNLNRNSFTSFPLFLGDLPQLSEFYSSGWFNLLDSISHANSWSRQSSAGSSKWPFKCQSAPLPPTALCDPSFNGHHCCWFLL